MPGDRPRRLSVHRPRLRHPCKRQRNLHPPPNPTSLEEPSPQTESNPEEPIEPEPDEPTAFDGPGSELRDNPSAADDDGRSGLAFPNAAGEPQDTSSATSEDSADTVLLIGDGQPYAGFAEAIEAIPSADAGDVVFKVTSDLYQDYREYLSRAIAFELPADRGITSFTITSDATDTVTVGNAGNGFYSIHLYTCGIATTIEAPLKMNAYIYGGANGTPLSADTRIAVCEGAHVSRIYGGSLNADLAGSSTIVVGGTADAAFGGCRAYASADGLPSASAVMSGSSSISVTETGSVKAVYGGGEACFPDSGDAPLTATADLNGSTSIAIDGTNDEAYGGGSAGAASIALDRLSNTTAAANVAGDSAIVFGAKAQAFSSSSSFNKLKVWGGGLATGTKLDSNRATADVLGCARITALEDDTAALGQPNAKAFSRFYGGGCALYRNAQASVGSTEIKTARCGWESAAGIIGGGYAGNGGTADVLGTARVEVFGFEGQRSGYENANLIAGGGLAESNADDCATSAKAGSTEVVVHASANLVSGSSTGMNIVGGGIAKGNKCSADVIDGARITVDSDTLVSQGIVGGGIVWGSEYDGRPQGARNASADVGATSISLGSGATVGGLFVGGGYAYKEALNSTANVRDNVEATIEDGCTLNGNFTVGGGMANAANDCEAVVEGSVATTFGSNVSTKSFVGGGLAYNKANNCTTSVRGSVDTAFDANYTMTAGQFIGGGYIFYNATDCTSAVQSVRTAMGDNANLTGKWIAAAGRIASNSTGDARTGTDTIGRAVAFEAGSDFSAYVFSAGGYIDGAMSGASTVEVGGNVATSFAGGDIKFYYGGAYLSGSNGNGAIDGNVESRFNGFSFPSQDGTMPKAGSDITGDAKMVFENTTLASGYSASSASNIGGDQIVNFLGTSTLSDFVYAEHDSGVLIIEIGDDEGTPTTATMSGIYSPNHIGETNVLIHTDATLVPNTTSANDSGAPYHLMGVYDIELEEGGNLLTYNENPTTIYGSLRGASSADGEHATITMPASAALSSDEHGAGTLEGNLTIRPTGTVADGMVLLDFDGSSDGTASLDSEAGKTRYLAPDRETQPGRTRWTIATGTAVTVKQADHGRIDPGEASLGKGEPVTYTFTPEYGFRVESVLIDGEPIADSGVTDGRTVTYTFTPSGSTCEVSAVFAALEKEDLHDEIAKLPDSSGNPVTGKDDRNAILDAKLDYEAYIEANPDTPLDPNVLDKLHEALLRLPEIEVEIVVEAAVDGTVEIPEDCLHRFAYQLDRDEIQALRDGSVELLKIQAVVDENTSEPQAGEDAALSAALGSGWALGKHFDVSVTKLVYGKKSDAEPLSSEPLHNLEKGITMTFPIPPELAAPEGVARTYAVVRVHQEDDGGWEATVLADENGADPSSVTITSDRFSRYAIVYREDAVSSDPIRPGKPMSPGNQGDPATEPAFEPNGSRGSTGSIAAVGDRTPAFGITVVCAGAIALLGIAHRIRKRIS